MKIDSANKENDTGKTETPTGPIAVAKGHVKKRSSITKISDIFVAQDIKSVGSFVFERVVVPALQRLAVDTINSVARGIFMGESAIGSGNVGNRSPASHTSYNSIYDASQPKATVSSNHRTKGDYQFAELVFDSYGEAQLVLDKMDECLSDAGVVTIADMYQFADVSCPFTGNYYGWHNISTAKIVADSDGYWIKMPKARPVKD